MEGYVSVPPVFLGLESLYAACRRIYPDQPNPLQVTALLKYWLGGPDPLDYISMYSNPGDTEKGVPPHWHYISFGLSDLHGDGRVHEISNTDSPSGFGFELSFRLKREPDETAPPTWPAAIMQALAKYVFQSENRLCSGDHVSWHCPLDNSESRIQHMLMTEDPQLGMVSTPFGTVNFIQIVGVCKEELQAAQRWNGPGIIDLMKAVDGAGGDWLVTDMRRGETIFEIDPDVQEAVEEGIESEGSNVSGVSARCSWSEKMVPPAATSVQEEERSNENLENSIPPISELESEQIKATLKKGLLGSKMVLPPIKSNKLRNSTVSLNQNTYDSSNEMATLESGELLRTRSLESVHIQLNLEAGAVLPLALKKRGNSPTIVYPFSRVLSLKEITSTGGKPNLLIRLTLGIRIKFSAGINLLHRPVVRDSFDREKIVSLSIGHAGGLYQVPDIKTIVSHGVSLLDDTSNLNLLLSDAIAYQFCANQGALKGRLKHGRHFTLKSVVGDVAVTLVPQNVAGAFVHLENPYAAHGPWLQVLLTDNLIQEMIVELEEVSRPEMLELPKTYCWPEHRLSITLLPEEY